jgi:hypothetical protein
MTTGLDTQVPDLAAVAATEENQPQMIRILGAAELDVVNGGSLHFAVVYAARQYLLAEGWKQYFKSLDEHGVPGPG